VKDNNGYIRLHRKILESGIYKTEKLFKLAITLLLLANHAEGQWMGHKIKRGQLVTGRKSLSKLTHINESTIYKNLKKLENMRFCNIESNNEFSLISILKYDQYQSDGNNQSNNEVTTREQRGNTNKKNKKNKKDMYPDNVLKIAEILNVEPTEGLDRYLNDIYKKYTFKNLTITMVQWCEDNKVEPTIARWMNWVRRAEKNSELEVRDK
jgi:hypothetical protein